MTAAIHDPATGPYGPEVARLFAAAPGAGRPAAAERAGWLSGAAREPLRGPVKPFCEPSVVRYRGSRHEAGGSGDGTPQCHRAPTRAARRTAYETRS